MSRKTHSKSGRKSRYRRRPISARASNRKGAVTWRTCFLLRWGRKTNRNKLLAKVTAVIFRPTAGESFSSPPWVQSNVLLS